MNTLQINQKITAPGFLGAFPYDQLPTKPDSKLFSIIVNTDLHNEPGDHWIVLLFKEPQYYFFDSYGRSFKDVTFPAKFSKTLKNYIGSTRFRYNKKLLQQFTSNVCGEYCVYFIENMTNNSFEKLMRVFSTNLFRNDIFVTDYVKKL